jgi:hypothetical protein
MQTATSAVDGPDLTLITRTRRVSLGSGPVKAEKSSGLGGWGVNRSPEPPIAIGVEVYRVP